MIRFPTTSHEWHMQNMEEMRRDQCSRKYPNDLATGHAGPLRLTRPSPATPEAASRGISHKEHKEPRE